MNVNQRAIYTSVAGEAEGSNSGPPGCESVLFKNHSATLPSYNLTYSLAVKLTISLQNLFSQLVVGLVAEVPFHCGSESKFCPPKTLHNFFTSYLLF